MKLYNFKIKRAQEASHNHFFLQNVPNNEIFQIFKMFQNNIWVNVYYTKINACSPWTVCSVFVWKCIFWVNLVQKLRIISLSWNFVPRLIQICRIPWWCSPFWANLVKKNQNVSLSWICKKTNLNKWNSIRMFTFSVFDHKYLSWTNLVQKFKIVCSKWNLIQRLIRICKIQWWCLFYLF